HHPEADQPIRRPVRPDEQQRRGEVHRHRRYGAIDPLSMMCTFGVPGNMIHGPTFAGTGERPVVSDVAPGMYTTSSVCASLLTLPVDASHTPALPKIWYIAAVLGIGNLPLFTSAKRTESTPVPFTPCARSSRPRAMNG